MLQRPNKFSFSQRSTAPVSFEKQIKFNRKPTLNRERAGSDSFAQVIDGTAHVDAGVVGVDGEDAHGDVAEVVAHRVPVALLQWPVVEVPAIVSLSL
jgi:hypothetical protein